MVLIKHLATSHKALKVHWLECNWFVQL